MSDPRSDEERRDRIITFRVEDDEADRVRAAAEARGLSLSSYLRLAILAKVRRDDLARRLTAAEARIAAVEALCYQDEARGRASIQPGVIVTGAVPLNSLLAPHQVRAALADPAQKEN